MLRDKIFKRVLLLYVGWRVALLGLMFLAIKYVPLGQTDRFLGGGVPNYLKLPELFSWANFDGEHYLSISIFGYKGLEQAFFPVYPVLMTVLTTPFRSDMVSSELLSTVAGLVISNLALVAALYLLWRLIKIDYSERVALHTILVLLLFPTAFYLGAVYSESIYLLISVASFYAARRGKWWLAALLGGVSSATRIFGVLLLPAYIVEAWQTKLAKRSWVWLLLVPLGLLTYMGYQYLTVGDALAFYRLQKLVGEQHQSGLTLLPQVYYRYIKMLLTVDIHNPIYSIIVLEFVTGLMFFALPIIGLFKKVRLSYLLYALAGFLSPTIQGSLSSVPRYILVFFPSFLVLALLILDLPKWLRVLYFLVSTTWLVVNTMLFLRGYWVA